MVYACRICQYEELVDNKCVYRNDLLTVARCVLVFFLFFLLFKRLAERKLESQPIWARMRLWYALELLKDLSNTDMIISGTLQYPMSTMWPR